MKLENVQAHVASLISAVPELAAFGTPIQYTPFLDDLTLKQQITDALRTVGVVIEIGGVEAERIADNSSGRGVVAEASFEVFVAESPKVTHTPSGQALRKAVIEAVMAIQPYETRCEFAKSETAVTEQGYILHVITFTQRVTIP